MKQQVNLLSDDLLPRREPLGFAHLLAAWAVFGWCCVLFSGWEGVRRLADGDRSSPRLSPSGNCSKRPMNSSKQEQASRADGGLRDEVESLRTARAEQQQLMALLKDYQTGQANGFSGFLDDLADHQVKGMWLSQIRLDQGGRRIQLKGLTTDPVHVPAVPGGAVEGPQFQRSSFRRFRTAGDRSRAVRVRDQRARGGWLSE